MGHPAKPCLCEVVVYVHACLSLPLCLQLQACLTQPPEGPRQVQIVTGFLGKGVHTGAITTLGRGGSDLSATVLGAAMELKEVQVRTGST